MTNNILYVSDGDYGKRVGYLAAVVQGQYGQVIPLEIRDLANNVVDLTGYSTITGTLNDQRGNVTNIAGTLALDGTPSTAPQVNWTVAAADFGTPGVFMVMLSLSNGSATLKTIPVPLSVHADPAVTAVAGTALVGVTTAQAALIAAISALTGLVKMAAGSATGIAVQSFMETFLGAANAAAARTAIGAGTGSGDLLASNNLSELTATASTARTNIGAAALGANTFTGEQTFADQLLTRPVIKDYGETVNAIGSTGGGTQDIDLTLGNAVSATVDTSANTFTFSNPSASGTACSFTLFLTNGGSQTVNWPASVNWAGGTAPTLTAAGVDILTFATLDGGTTWYGFAAGLDMS